jgi:hypothetical protein
MKEARESHIKELVRFVNGIERDYEAVRASVTHAWNQGDDLIVVKMLAMVPERSEQLLVNFISIVTLELISSYYSFV